MLSPGFLEQINPATPLVVLTGAGVSRESGLATFRDTDGIWAKVRLEDVATPTVFARDPVRVHAFYNARRRQILLPEIVPNAGHLALAELEQYWKGGFLLVTQNVDDLHERAGSRRLHHLHGELLRSLCARCGHQEECRADLAVENVCAACGKPGGVRPQVVWFGEIPLGMDEIHRGLARCGLFVSIGTSGHVYPAAGFVEAANLAGARTLELNLEPSEGASAFDEAVYGPATTVVPEVVRQLRALV